MEGGGGGTWSAEKRKGSYENEREREECGDPHFTEVDRRAIHSINSTSICKTKGKKLYLKMCNKLVLPHTLLAHSYGRTH